MFRIDFGRCMLENIKELLLFMLLHAWARACIRCLDSCVRSFVLAYAGMFLRFYIRGDGPAYARSCLRTWAWPAYMRRLVEALLYPFLLFFICFTSACNPNTPFCHFCIWISLYPSFHLNFCIENIIFHQFCLNQESNVIFFFAVIIPLC